MQQQRSADPLLFIGDYVQQVAATGKLPLELGGNIHLFRQRYVMASSQSENEK